MCDGVRLCTDIYLPDVSWPLPTMLIRMPYGKREAYCYMPAHGKYWARRGYACVIQDVRGRWSSEGAFQSFVNEGRDGWDTLDWIVAQPWSNGSVAMTGESYYGYTQWAVAVLGHPSLKCIAPGDTAADIYGSWVYVNNCFCQQTMGVWVYGVSGRRDVNPYRFDPWHLPLESAARASGRNNDTYCQWIANPLRNGYWDTINVSQHYDRVQIPVMHWGGWYDTFLTGTIGGWRGVRGRAGSDDRGAPQRLVLGATDHELTPEFSGRVGRHRLESAGYAHDRVAAFTDRWMRPGTSKGLDGSDVSYFTIGRQGWRTASDWPPVGFEPSRLYLRGQGHAGTLAGDGRLSPVSPDQEPPDEFLYDPDNPVRYWLDASLWEMATYLRDRRRTERRPDVLVYTGEILEHDLEISGGVEATLHVSTSARDTDFTVAIVDVFPDGHAHLIQEGITRLRCRESDTRESPVEPHAVYELQVDMWATSYLVPRGHRLRVEVSSSNFDRYARNLNTAEPYGTGVASVVARQTVFHDRSRPSCVTVWTPGS